MLLPLVKACDASGTERELHANEHLSLDDELAQNGIRFLTWSGMNMLPKDPADVSANGDVSRGNKLGEEYKADTLGFPAWISPSFKQQVTNLVTTMLLDGDKVLQFKHQTGCLHSRRQEEAAAEALDKKEKAQVNFATYLRSLLNSRPKPPSFKLRTWMALATSFVIVLFVLFDFLEETTGAVSNAVVFPCLRMHGITCMLMFCACCSLAQQES